MTSRLVASVAALYAFGCAGPEATAEKRPGTGGESAATPGAKPAAKLGAKPGAKLGAKPGAKSAPASPARGSRVEVLLARHVEPLVAGEAPLTFVSVGVFTGTSEHFAGFAQAGSSFRPTADSQFHVASLTKPHTALLAALSVVAGRLELDGALADCRRRRVAAFCARPKTTLRHLLSHSAGLPAVPKDSRGGEYDAAKLRRYLERAKPSTAPGRRFRYSTTGYGAVALVVARANQGAFVELLRERVLKPIASRAVVRVGDAARLVRGHRRGKVAKASPTREAFIASGALIASARDLLQLVAANADPSRVPGLRKAIKLTHEINWDLRGFRGAAVALGWQVDRERQYYWHPGVSSVHRTAMAFDPKRQTGIVIMAGQHMALADYRLEDAAFAVLDGLAAKEKGAGR